MEKRPSTLRTAIIVSSVSQESPGRRLRALLGQKELPFEGEKRMSCLGVQGWQSLLVY
jgi:hypothetical protein